MKSNAVIKRNSALGAASQTSRRSSRRSLKSSASHHDGDSKHRAQVTSRDSALHKAVNTSDVVDIEGKTCDTMGAVEAIYHTPFPLTGRRVLENGRIYRTACKQDFLIFRNLADSLSEFTLRFDNKETVVWDKKLKGESMNLIKVFGVLHGTPPSLLYDVLQDSIYRVEWDEFRINAFRIVLLNSNNDIGYYSARMPTGITNRDFVNQRMWHSAGDGEYAIFNTSVEHSSEPAKKGFVRAISKVSGYLVRPWGKEKDANGETKSCCLTYITHTDPRGWIPSSIINYVTTKFAPNTIATLSKASQGFREWCAKQKNYDKHWEAPPEPYDEPIRQETIDFVKMRWGVTD